MRRYVTWLLLLAIVAAASGCYLTHVAIGQTRLLAAREPIASVLADPALEPDVRERLVLVEETRSFARDLGLEVGGQYTSFVAWPGDRIVTTVVATRPGEVDPAGFFFPIVGRLPYKGFFDADRAAREARSLRDDGLDVCELGVRAYSTLGWLDDPITGPMLRYDPGQLVETILHELVHATFYVRGEPDFNEGIASFIGEEGSVQFYADRGESERATSRRRGIEDRHRIDAELLRLRDEVSALYESSEAGADRERERSALEDRSRQRISALELDDPRLADLATSLRLNDACLALTATYSADLDRYRARFEQLGSDLPAFIARAVAAADADAPTEALLAP